MDVRPIAPIAVFETSLSTLFKTHPNLFGFFIRHHLACSACPFSKFCNLQDVLKFYAPPPEFIAGVMDEIRPKLVLDHVN